MKKTFPQGGLLYNNALRCTRFSAGTKSRRMDDKVIRRDFVQALDEVEAARTTTSKQSGANRRRCKGRQVDVDADVFVLSKKRWARAVNVNRKDQNFLENKKELKKKKKNGNSSKKYETK